MSELERMVVLLAGYNPRPNIIKRTLNSIKMKIFYDEQLVDTEDAANMNLNPEQTVFSITKPLEALADLGYAKAIVVGNEDHINQTLSHSIKAQNVVKKVVPMGNSFLVNALKGKKAWLDLYEQSSNPSKISPHKFILFGDTFYATPESLDQAFLDIERRDADLSFGYVTLQDNDLDKRWLFDYRPWGAFTVDGMPIKFRNANIGAERTWTFQDDHIPKGLPSYGLEVIQTAYNVRKAWNPLNWVKAAQAIGQDGAKLLYQKLTKGTIDLRDLEQVVSKKLRCDFGMIEVDADLEPDVDSAGDIYRARKMNYLDEHPTSTIKECEDLFHKKCIINGQKDIIVTSSKVKRQSRRYVATLLKDFKQGDFSKSPYPTRSFDKPDIHIAHLRYDLFYS